jgi:hypothetical protein
LRGLTFFDSAKTECAIVNKSTFQFEYRLFTETVTFATGEPAGSTVVLPATASDSKEIVTIEEYSDSDSQDYSITMEVLL